MIKLVGDPKGAALSAIRHLARRHRVIGEDDLVAAMRGASGVSAADRAAAFTEAERRRIVHHRPGGLWDSMLFPTL